jgi:hypothetical protein
MVHESPGRTFISYSRKDGTEFAAWLRGWLGERNLSVWQDIIALEGGRDWLPARPRHRERAAVCGS